MNTRTLLLACEDPGDADRFSAALPVLNDQAACRIVILHVIEKIFPVASLASLGGGLILPPPPDEAELQWQAARAGEARRQLAVLRDRLPARYPVSLRVEHGPPAETICRVAVEEQASLILLASHRRGCIRRWLLGRTARRVVDAAPCHVVVLGPGAGVPRTGARSSAGEKPRRPARALALPLAAPPRGA